MQTSVLLLLSAVIILCSDISLGHSSHSTTIIEKKKIKTIMSTRNLNKKNKNKNKNMCVIMLFNELSVELLFIVLMFSITLSILALIRGHVFFYVCV